MCIELIQKSDLIVILIFCGFIIDQEKFQINLILIFVYLHFWSIWNHKKLILIFLLLIIQFCYYIDSDVDCSDLLAWIVNILISQLRRKQSINFTLNQLFDTTFYPSESKCWWKWIPVLEIKILCNLAYLKFNFFSIQ